MLQVRVCMVRLPNIVMFVRYFPNTVRVGPSQKNMPEHLQRISIENLINAKLTEQARHEGIAYHIWKSLNCLK